MYQFTYPFAPPMEDLKRVVKGSKGSCYLFDTFCKDMSREEKIRRERKLLDSYTEHMDALAIRAATEERVAVSDTGEQA